VQQRGGADLFFRRFTMGVQLPALLLAGQGVAWLAAGCVRLLEARVPRWPPGLSPAVGHRPELQLVTVSGGPVGAGHKGGEILGVQEGGRRRWAPGVQAAGAFQVFGRPQLVVDDAVHVAVVLAEAACGVP
jgi:hypothetical protein